MYREQIDAYIESQKEQMLEDLAELVKIDSQRTEEKPGMPYGEGPAKALETAQKLMKNYGLDTKNYDNRVVTGDFGPGEKELDILAHLDVVPVTEDWTVTKPFEPLILNGNIYGRGTADDKGPAIAALYAVRAIKELKLPLKKSVRLVFGSDEECGSSDLKYYYSVEKEAPYTFTPDGDFPVINLEKARLEKKFQADFGVADAMPKILSLKAGDKSNVVPGKAEAIFAGLSDTDLKTAAAETAKDTGACFTWESTGDKIILHAKGTAAHASTPEAGNNALTALLCLIKRLPIANSEGYRKLCALARLFPHGDTCGKALKVDMSDDISGALTMSLGVLRYTQEHLEGIFDCRAPLCATEENLTEIKNSSGKL